MIVFDEQEGVSTGCLVIAGLSGGSGKSVASVALTAALRRSRKVVVPFKKGPDYIDAGWMSTAAGRPCYNLDPYLMSEEVIATSFQQQAAGADFALVEGNRGLYDGVTAEGGFSTAELAVQLDLPIVLVVNCSKTTRTVAALVLGCQELDKRVRIVGVILNQIATPRHERIITEAVEKYTGIPVVGIVPRMKTDIFPMRHLGVTPHQEYGAAATSGAVEQLAAIAEEHFDLQRIIDLMEQRSFTPLPSLSSSERSPDSPMDSLKQPSRAGTGKRKPVSKPIRIGVLRDAAFQFYYQENLEALEKGGAELVMINALTAQALPDDLKALYIGGGFPETSAAQLADNVSFRDSVSQAAEQGLPMYAECGGLIFLGQAIIIQGKEYPLAGVFPVTLSMSSKPQAHGYSAFRVDRENPFYQQGTLIKGHEFRYSVVEKWDGDPEDLALQMERGTGFQGKRDGLIKKNVLAMYTHVLAPGTPEWAAGLLRAAGVDEAF
ncbi:MAG: cobyrinate a,c-diamide synthase [Candidatus Electrothrix sp. AW3_4]|nr:cobyrinate a,c-diamide synthase [Candidatus Electrothrix gigas]